MGCPRSILHAVPRRSSDVGSSYMAKNKTHEQHPWVFLSAGQPRCIAHLQTGSAVTNNKPQCSLGGKKGGEKKPIEILARFPVHLWTVNKWEQRAACAGGISPTKDQNRSFPSNVSWKLDSGHSNSLLPFTHYRKVKCSRKEVVYAVYISMHRHTSKYLFKLSLYSTWQ